MSKKNKILSLIVASIMSFSAYAEECKNFNTRYINNKLSVAKKETLCINAELTKASSKNCMFLRDPKCPFKELKKIENKKNFVSEIGSPGFNLCHYIEGSPQIYEVEISGKWMTFERCFGKKSSEFADLGELYGLYLAL